MKDLKHPTTVSQVRSVHGALTFYRSFVPNFARIMKPIIGLLRKEDGPVLWTSACTKALNDVISAIECSGLMLARFD